MISAMLLWALTGIGFAGSYMPGLKALTDRLDPGESSRSLTFYTSAFSFGVGLSFLACQLIADAFGWRWAFILTGLPPLIMTFVAWSLKPVTPAPRAGPLLHLAPALRNRAALGTPSPTARTASNSTAFAPGWSPSGALSRAQRRRAARRRRGERARHRARHAGQHPRQRTRP